MDVAKLRAAGAPLERLLPGTDHPSGNRRGAATRPPGRTTEVESHVAAAYGLSEGAVRQQFCSTFIDARDVEPLLPPGVRAMLAHARASRG